MAITQAGTPAYAVWTPDSKRIVYAAGATGNRNLFWSAADGSGAPERLTTSEFSQYPSSWSPDGRTLLFIEQNGTAYDIWALDVSARPPAPRLVLRNADHPALSPDGRWLAYASRESRAEQVYVQPFPNLGARQQISGNGGTSPVWAHDGRRIFYLQESRRQGGHVVSADVTTGSSFSAGIPRPVSDLTASLSFYNPPATAYDVGLDGASFLASQTRPALPEPPTTAIQLTFNAFDELRTRAPAKK